MGLEKDKDSNKDEDRGKDTHLTKRGGCERGGRHEIIPFLKK